MPGDHLELAVGSLINVMSHLDPWLFVDPYEYYLSLKPAWKRVEWWQLWSTVAKWLTSNTFNQRVPWVMYLNLGIVALCTYRECALLLFLFIAVQIKIIGKGFQISTDEKQKHLNMLSIKNRHIYYKAVMMYKVRHGGVPNYISSLFKRPCARYNSNNFLIPSARIDMYQRSLAFAGTLFLDLVNLFMAAVGSVFSLSKCGPSFYSCYWIKVFSLSRFGPSLYGCFWLYQSVSPFCWNEIQVWKSICPKAASCVFFLFLSARSFFSSLIILLCMAFEWIVKHGHFSWRVCFFNIITSLRVFCKSFFF